MPDNTLAEYLGGLVKEVTPPILSEEETANRILARERTMTMRLPVLVHWQLQRTAQALGQTKTAFAEELLTRAATDALSVLQESGHLPLHMDLAEAMDYYRATTRQGEASEPGGEVELEVLASSIKPDDLKEGDEVAVAVRPVVNRSSK